MRSVVHKLLLAVVLTCTFAACLRALPHGRGWTCETDGDCKGGMHCQTIENLSTRKAKHVCLNSGEQYYDHDATGWLDYGIVGGLTLAAIGVLVVGGIQGWLKPKKG